MPGAAAVGGGRLWGEGEGDAAVVEDLVEGGDGVEGPREPDERGELVDGLAELHRGDADVERGRVCALSWLRVFRLARTVTVMSSRVASFRSPVLNTSPKMNIRRIRPNSGSLSGADLSLGPNSRA